MAEATVLRADDTNTPYEEVVQLTASDAETYTSKKYSKITGATVSQNSTPINSPIGASWADGSNGANAVVTIHGTGIVDENVTLVIKGHLGN